MQEFSSDVVGNSKCFGHVECDAIIKDDAKVIAIPKIIANNVGNITKNINPHLEVKTPKIKITIVKTMVILSL